jgi:uncharacterized membrane protein YcaP (DUF421 family)
VSRWLTSCSGSSWSTFGIALAVRLAGTRDLAQLNSFDLVVTLLPASVVQNATAAWGPSTPS